LLRAHGASHCLRAFPTRRSSDLTSSRGTVRSAMAKESTFDIVSEVDSQEVANAVNQASKEIQQRYDFKDTGASVEHSENTINLRDRKSTRLNSSHVSSSYAVFWL